MLHAAGYHRRAVLVGTGKHIRDVAHAQPAFLLQASAQQTIKVAYTDPLSGPFAQVGDANLKQMQYIIDFINAKGGALGKKFELVPFDNKSQPSDALIALKSATDRTCPSSCSAAAPTSPPP